MKLTPEQNAALASWVSAGDNLSTVQKKLAQQFKLTLTYMDVRFLVDDLNLTLKDAAPSPAPATAAQTDLSKIAPPQAGQSAPQAHSVAPFDDDELDGNNVPPGAQRPPSPQNPHTREDEAYDEDDAVPPQMPEGAPDAPASDVASNIRVEVDNVTLMPGALASGSVTFTDGVTGKWIVDQYGRPGFTQISKQNYRPTQADAQAFMQELGAALQKKGLM